MNLINFNWCDEYDDREDDTCLHVSFFLWWLVGVPAVMVAWPGEWWPTGSGRHDELDGRDRKKKHNLFCSS